jgi:hypothetical protein
VTYVRLGLAFAGFAAALLAIAFRDQRLGWGAIALLGGSLVMRLVQRGWERKKQTPEH